MPSERIEAVLAKLDRVRVAEAEMDAKVANGLATTGLIDELVKTGRVEYVD